MCPEILYCPKLNKVDTTAIYMSPAEQTFDIKGADFLVQRSIAADRETSTFGYRLAALRPQGDNVAMQNQVKHFLLVDSNSY